MNDDRITALDLIVGNFSEVTIGKISADLESALDVDLFFGLALISRIGLVFQMAYGEQDPRSIQVASVMGPIGHEMERRGLDGNFVNLDAAFDGWCNELSTCSQYSETISTVSLSMLRGLTRQTLANISGLTLPQEFTAALEQIDVASTKVLESRGVVAEMHYSGGIQA